MTPKLGVDDREAGEGAARGVGEEMIDRLRRHCVVAREAVGREGDAVPGDVPRVVVAGGDAALRQPLPDRRRWIQPHRQVGLVARGRGGVKVIAVGPGRPHHRGEPAVTNRVLVAQAIEKRRGGALVVAHHLGLVGAWVDEHEAVVAPAVERVVRRNPIVLRVQIGPLGRREVDRHRQTGAVEVGLDSAQPVHDLRARIAGIGRQRAEQMIERAVLHHHDDDGVDPRQQPRRRAGSDWTRGATIGPRPAGFQPERGRSHAKPELQCRAACELIRF